MSRHFGGAPVGRQTDKARILLVLSFLFLLLFGALAYLYLKPDDKAGPKRVVIEKEPELKMVDVLVPLRNIEAGVQLQRAMFKQEKRPAVSVDKGTIRDFEEIIGHYARTMVIQGLPLHQEHITNVRPISAISSPLAYEPFQPSRHSDQWTNSWNAVE